MGGHSNKNNIWSSGFTIAFVVVCVLNPVFETFIGHRRKLLKGNNLRVFAQHWHAPHQKSTKTQKAVRDKTGWQSQIQWCKLKLDTKGMKIVILCLQTTERRMEYTL